MSYYLVVGGEKWTQVASVSGWREFREHIAGLDDAEQVKHLVDHGWCQKLPELAEQVKQAVAGASENVKSIGQAMLDALSAAPEGAESCLLTDGLTSVEDPDDSGWSEGEEQEGEPEAKLFGLPLIVNPNMDGLPEGIEAA